MNDALNCRVLLFSRHALQRMFERGLQPAEIRKVLESGAIIKRYPQDVPYPSCLILGMIRNRPLHVVVGLDRAGSRCIVITVYEPNPAQWDSSFSRRKT